jgi:pimeloyl-ACP methyl ester carboxylesterase
MAPTTTARAGESMNFVLIHGGWQGGWCWDGVAADLRAAGHAVFAPTLRGLEEGDVDRAGVTLQDMADGAIAALLEQDLHDVVLVGHSGGGAVIQLIADRLPERIQRVIFVDAWVLHNGETVNDILPPPLVEGVLALAANQPDRTIPMPPELFSSAFMQDATPEQLASVLPRLVPSPLGWLDQPIRLERFHDLDLPSSYVFLRQDQAVPTEIYRTMAGRLKSPTIVECEGSHEAMLTRPKDLATALQTAAR